MTGFGSDSRKWRIRKIQYCNQGRRGVELIEFDCTMLGLFWAGNLVMGPPTYFTSYRMISVTVLKQTLLPNYVKQFSLMWHADSSPLTSNYWDIAIADLTHTCKHLMFCAWGRWTLCFSMWAKPISFRLIKVSNPFLFTILIFPVWLNRRQDARRLKANFHFDSQQTHQPRRASLLWNVIRRASIDALCRAPMLCDVLRRRSIIIRAYMRWASQSIDYITTLSSIRNLSHKKTLIVNSVFRTPWPTHSRFNCISIHWRHWFAL